MKMEIFAFGVITFEPITEPQFCRWWKIVVRNGPKTAICQSQILVYSKKAQKFNFSELFNELRRKGRAIKLKCFQSG